MLIGWICRTDDPIKNIKELYVSNKEPLLRKFVMAKSTKFFPIYIPQNMEELSYSILYLEIREPVISFLEQKYSTKSIYVEEAKLLFQNISNCSNMEEYVDRKIKELGNLDLENCIESKNRELKEKWRKKNDK